MPEEQSFTSHGPLHAPVLFMVYKRPDTTKRVFEAIRQAKPSRLYVAADGPKPDVPGEAEKVQQVRALVLNGVDWDCEVKTLFRDTNLGCKYGVSGGIDWFFENEEEGIILEDDILPSKEFFVFCQKGLDKYRENNEIAGIGGFIPHSAAYPFLSVHGSIWGWATWKRAWLIYNNEQKLDVKSYYFLAKNCSLMTAAEKFLIQQKAQRQFIDTWDYYWLFSRIHHRKYMVMPGAPLTKNVGFDANSGAHLNGQKPVPLKKAEKIEIHKSSLDYSLLNKKPKNIIFNDYKRMYTRHGNKSLQYVLKMLINRPLITFKVIYYHLSKILIVNKKLREIE